MATGKVNLGQKDAAVILRDAGKDKITCEVWQPKGTAEDPVSQAEICALYLAWALEQEDIRTKYMAEAAKKRNETEGKTKGKAKEKAKK